MGSAYEGNTAALPRGRQVGVRESLVQGEERRPRPEIASPMKGDLRGVVELTTNEEGNTYRVYYTLKCPGYVYVLYCHKKKSKRGSEIPKHEKDLILERYRTAMADCKETLRV